MRRVYLVNMHLGTHCLQKEGIAELVAYLVMSYLHQNVKKPQRHRLNTVSVSVDRAFLICFSISLFLIRKSDKNREQIAYR